MGPPALLCRSTLLEQRFDTGWGGNQDANDRPQEGLIAAVPRSKPADNEPPRGDCKGTGSSGSGEELSLRQHGPVRYTAKGLPAPGKADSLPRADKL